MRNHARWRATWAAVAASGLAAFVAAFALPRPVSNDLVGALAV